MYIAFMGGGVEQITWNWLEIVLFVGMLVIVVMVVGAGRP